MLPYRDIYSRAVEICARFCPRVAHSAFVWYAPHDCSHSENVARIARELYPAFFRDNLNRPMYAILTCAAYLHDVGMFLFPSEINRLEIHAERLRIYGPKGEEIIKKYNFFFSGCNESEDCVISNAGVVKINTECAEEAPKTSADPQCIKKRARISKFIRKIHPVISQVYIERHLPYELMARAGAVEEFARRFAELVGRVVALHGKGAVFSQREEEFQGYRIDVGRLGALITLADALDLTRHQPLDRIATTLCADYTQVAHNIFKTAIKGVVVKGGEVRISFNSGSARARRLGALLFEIGKNLAGDYLHVTSAGFAQLQIVIEAGREIPLTQDLLRQLKQVADKLENEEENKELKSIMLDEFRRVGGCEKLTRHLEEKCQISQSRPDHISLREIFGCAGNNPSVSIFDILAVASVLELATEGLIRHIMEKLPPDVRRIADAVM